MVTYLVFFSQLFKVHSTYVSGIKPYINNSVLRTQWDQTSAATGRLQSCKPNIQAVPKTSVECPTDQGHIFLTSIMNNFSSLPVFLKTDSIMMFSL